MQKLNWVDKICNKVLQRLNKSITMLDTVRKRKHVSLLLVLRHESLSHDIIDGRMKGKATRSQKKCTR